MASAVWRKVHLAIDAGTGDIRAMEFTPSRAGDSPVLPDLLEQIPKAEAIDTVTADGAYDTRRCHTAILERGATPILPIHRNGRMWKEDERVPSSEARPSAPPAPKVCAFRFSLLKITVSSTAQRYARDNLSICC